jgi:hypothetical protein
MDTGTLVGMAVIAIIGVLWIALSVLAACMRSSQISREQGE